MFKKLIQYILNNIFKVSTQTTEKQIDNNSKYAMDYANIDSINFTSIFSNKLANYTINDSNLNILGENARVDLLNKIGQSLWKKGKKITAMAFGYGGVILVPYAKGGKLYYDLVPQSRLTIDNMDGDLITGATILAEKKIIRSSFQDKIYMRWANYQIKDNNLTILQQYSDGEGNKIPAPEFWQGIMESLTISNVDRVTFGFIKSPINNRLATDNMGVPITYGCDETIAEIKETMKQMLDEYRDKKTFIGVDATLFNSKNGLPQNGIYKKFDFGDDNTFEIFDPQFRPYTERLQELYRRLESEIGVDAGFISEKATQNATATEIKRSMFSTYALIDDMRSNIEKGLEDFFYACNVIANAYNLSPQGEYELDFDWDYSLLEDSQETFSQLIQGVNQGVIKKAELRQFIKPSETIEQSKEAITEIEENNPNIEDLLGTKNKEEE